MDDLAELRRFLRWPSLLLTVIMLGVMIHTPLQAEGDPQSRQVREAVYGDKPLGLPWLVVHSAVCCLICTPLPLCVVSTGEMIGAGDVLGVRPRWNWISSLFRSYRAISAVPELRGLYWRVTLTWGWYLAWFAGWIVLTSILGV
jgi:hypothetical protein